MSSYFLRGHTGLASNADILPTSNLAGFSQVLA
jgi:hypothetical protein